VRTATKTINEYGNGPVKGERALSLRTEDVNQKRVPADGHMIREKILYLYERLPKVDLVAELMLRVKGSNLVSAGWLNALIL
jgi:hypothetical protein